MGKVVNHLTSTGSISSLGWTADPQAQNSFTFLKLFSFSSRRWAGYIYIVPKGGHENRTKGVENKADDMLKLAVFLECPQC